MIWEGPQQFSIWYPLIFMMPNDGRGDITAANYTAAEERRMIIHQCVESSTGNRQLR